MGCVKQDKSNSRLETEAANSAVVRGPGERSCDVELLRGIRLNDERALRRFVSRFRPILLDQARRLGVDRNERNATITEFLDDILIKLEQISPPGALPAFVVTSFRNSLANAERDAAVRERHICEELETDSNEAVVYAGCSEFMIRSAESCDRDDPGESAVNASLLQQLLDGCSEDDVYLLTWSAHRIPLRDCADWLGVGYDNAKQRLSRLRSRITRRSLTLLPELSAAERDVMLRLLRRASIVVNPGSENISNRGSAA